MYRDYNAALNILDAAGLAESLNAHGDGIRLRLPETICYVPEAGKDNRHQPCHKNRRQHRFFFPFHPRSVKPDFDPIAD